MRILYLLGLLVLIITSTIGQEAQGYTASTGCPSNPAACVGNENTIFLSNYGTQFDGVNVPTGVNITGGSTLLSDNNVTFAGNANLFYIQGVGAGGGWWSSPGTITGPHTVTLANPAPLSSLKNFLTGVTVSTPGTGVNLYDEITLAGGTYAAPAKVIVATLTASSILLNTGGSGGTYTTYTVNSGVYNSTTGLVTLTLATSAGLAPGNIVNITTLTGTGSYASAEGSFTAGIGTTGITITYTIATGLTMTITGGASGIGICTITGTTGDSGSASTFTATGTLNSGALSGTLALSNGGQYVTPPTNLSAEPVTGCGRLAGATVSLTMGVGQVVPDPANLGNYSINPGTSNIAQASTTGSGTGTTFNVTWGTAQSLYYGTDVTSAIQTAVNNCEALPSVSINQGSCSVMLPSGVGLTAGALTVDKSNVNLVSAGFAGFELRDTTGNTNQRFPTKLLYVGNSAPPGGYVLTVAPLVSDIYRLNGNSIWGVEIDCNASPGCGGFLLYSITNGWFGIAEDEAFGTRYTTVGSTAPGSQIIQLSSVVGINIGDPVQASSFISGTYVASIDSNLNQITASTESSIGLASGAGFYIGGVGIRMDTETNIKVNDIQSNEMWLWGRNLSGFGPAFLLEGTSQGSNAGCPLCDYGNTSENVVHQAACYITFGDCLILNNTDHNIFYNVGGYPVGIATAHTVVSNGSLDNNNGSARYNKFDLLGNASVFRGTNYGGFTTASYNNQALDAVTSTAGFNITQDVTGGASILVNTDANNIYGGPARMSIAYGPLSSAGPYSFAVGYSAIASGQYAYAFGNTTSATADGAWASGQNTKASLVGEWCRGYGNVSSGYTPQSCQQQLYGVTTTASAIRLVNGNTGVGNSSNCVNITGNNAKNLSIQFVATDNTNPANAVVWTMKTGLLSRPTTNASTAFIGGTPEAITTGSVSGYSVSASADITNACLNLSFTPPTNNTDTWYAGATVQWTETHQ